MNVTWPPRNRTFGFVDALGVTGAAGLFVARFIPVAKLVPFWGCVLRRTTGWPCPGCGLTRVADRFAHGHFAGAFEANPLGAVAAMLFALAAVVTALHLAFALPLPRVELTPREARALRVAVGVLAVLNYAFVIVKTRFPGLL